MCSGGVRTPCRLRPEGSAPRRHSTSSRRVGGGGESGGEGMRGHHRVQASRAFAGGRALNLPRLTLTPLALVRSPGPVRARHQLSPVKIGRPPHTPGGRSKEATALSPSPVLWPPGRRGQIPTPAAAPIFFATGQIGQRLPWDVDASDIRKSAAIPNNSLFTRVLCGGWDSRPPGVRRVMFVGRHGSDCTPRLGLSRSHPALRPKRAAENGKQAKQPLVTSNQRSVGHR